MSHYFGEIKLSAPKNAIMKNEGEGGGFPGFPSPLLGLRPLPTAAGPLALLWSPLPGAGRGPGGTPKSPPPPQAQGGPILGTSGPGGGARTERGRGQNQEGRGQEREGAWLVALGACPRWKGACSNGMVGVALWEGGVA